MRRIEAPDRFAVVVILQGGGGFRSLRRTGYSRLDSLDAVVEHGDKGRAP